MLLDIRDEKIREQTIVKEDGESIVVDVVPSVKERREACKLILAYCWGTPVATGADDIERRLLDIEERLREVQPGHLQ